VSDVSQGLGWWLASDGKWYSPEQAPGPVPTNPIPDGRPLGGSAVPPTIPVSVPGTPSTPPGSASPPTSGYGLPPGAPGYGPPPSPAGYGYPTGYGYLPVQKTNGLAVASLVCSLLWVFGLGAVLAVVFGSISLTQIKRSNNMQRGRGLAIAGIIVGVLGLLAVALFIVVVVAVDHHCHQTGCTFNTTASTIP
jgi:hypothetical protein